MILLVIFVQSSIIQLIWSYGNDIPTGKKDTAALTQQVLEVIRPAVFRAVSTQIRSLEDGADSTAWSRSQPNSYVSQIITVLQPLITTAVTGALEAEAETGDLTAPEPPRRDKQDEQ